MFRHIDNKNTNHIDPWWMYAQFASIRPIKDIDQFDNLWLLFKSYLLEIYNTHTGQPTTHPKKVYRTYQLGALPAMRLLLCANTKDNPLTSTISSQIGVYSL